MQQLSDRNERSARSELSQSGQQPPNHSTEDGIGMRLVFLERCNKQLVSMGPCCRLRHGICSADDIFLVLFYVLCRPSGSLFFLLAFHLSFYYLVFIIRLTPKRIIDDYSAVITIDNSGSFLLVCFTCVPILQHQNQSILPSLSPLPSRLSVQHHLLNLFL